LYKIIKSKNKFRSISRTTIETLKTKFRSNIIFFNHKNIDSYIILRLQFTYLLVLYNITHSGSILRETPQSEKRFKNNVSIKILLLKIKKKICNRHDVHGV
jgi:hypothetical protein